MRAKILPMKSRETIKTKWGEFQFNMGLPQQIKGLSALLANHEVEKKIATEVINLYIQALTKAYEQGYERGVIEQQKDGTENPNIDHHVLKLTHRNVRENSGEHSLIAIDYQLMIKDVVSDNLGLTDRLTGVFYIGSVSSFNRGFIVGVASTMGVESSRAS